MKIEKNKIVFVSVIGLVIVFIISYSMMIFAEEEEDTLDTGKIPVPELQDSGKQYKSKLEAIDDLKEEQQRDAPSIYDERFLDSSGVYDPDLPEKEKQRIVDSIYEQGRIDYSKNTLRDRQNSNRTISKIKHISSSVNKTVSGTMDHQDLLKKQEDLFKKMPEEKRTKELLQGTDPVIPVVVTREQVVKTHSRLEMRTVKGSVIRGKYIPKNTYLYGFISFKPNRALIHITNIDQRPVSLKAYDLQDGNEGVYVVNNFKTEVSKAVVDDLVDNVNLPGVPSLDVVKNVFQHSGKRTKVTISANYQLILKPKS